MTFSLSLLPKAQILSNFSENSLEHVILRSEAPIGHTYPQGVYDDEGSTASTSRFFASALLRLTLRSDIFIIVATEGADAVELLSYPILKVAVFTT